MRENLLSPSSITLFGRVFPLAVDQESLAATLGANRFLREQLAHTVKVGTDDVPDAKFARIYAISYEGTYYNLSRPAIFLVHGDGTPAFPPVPKTPGPTPSGGEGPPLEPKPPQSQMARGPSGTDQSGVATKDGEFSSDIMMWEYDKGDFSLRLDVTTGTLEDILLEAEIETQLQISSAARVQISGAARMQISHAARMQISGRSGG